MMMPSSDQYHFRAPARANIPSGLDQVSNNLVGRYKRRRKILSEFSQQAEDIHVLSKKYANRSQGELIAATNCIKPVFLKDYVSDQKLNEAVALIAALSSRVLGLLPHKVQIIGILGLHKCYSLEMDTGEGKTLVAGLAGILMVWHKRPAHILTVNDYLAERDREFIQPLLECLHISSGVVLASMSQQERQIQYASELVYTTSHELLADFLRDRILLKKSRGLTHHNLCKTRHPDFNLATRGIHSVIVDELDSILIDQSVSPLIIAAPSENPLLEESIQLAHQLSQELEIHRHYRVDQKSKYIQVNGEGLRVIAKLSEKLPRMWQSRSRSLELIKQALSAREFYLINRHYVVEEEKVIIVDEFSGRKMPERSWSLGLHQAVEAKEGVPITAPNEVQERMSYQNFFRLFARMSGLSGTVKEAADELWQIYQLPLLKIPRNQLCNRISQETKIFPDKDSKWNYLYQIVHDHHNTGQPVLLGTRTIEDSEQVARLFDLKGLPYQLLNANFSKQEADIIASAGQEGAITIATNMAGRGTDISLDEISRKAGGLYVIVTERHHSSRIDRQLIGRCSRQGDPGKTTTILSLEDELIQQVLSQKSIGFLRRLSDIKPVRYIILGLFSLAQKKSERSAYKQRQQVLKNDINLKKSLSFSAGH
ncbi:hypothetical protein [Parendozoicomonas sp. Alg238-R29]|uniref:preprotein translocase subunit SecA n=1 Tax=Parendozoicomonas sp. Alg238-R29 TaxID=2993446 RepID=UPI00248D3BD1|nr:hypothetical protein [Parendozoicomonas sp. Alg238-R29]